MFTFLLLSGQNQASSLGALSMWQSQFLLNIVTVARSAVVRASVQKARASNQSVIVGNTGPIITGAQSANPLNVGP